MSRWNEVYDRIQFERCLTDADSFDTWCYTSSPPYERSNFQKCYDSLPPLTRYAEKEKEKRPMKIKPDSTFTIQQVLDAKTDECDEFYTYLGKFVELLHDQSLQAKARTMQYYNTCKPFFDNNPRALRWMVDKGLLEVEKEVTYRVGQRFTDKFGEEYMLIAADHSSCLFIKCSNGNRWDNRVEVDDLNKITQKEINKMSADNVFTLIPDKS